MFALSFSTLNTVFIFFFIFTNCLPDKQTFSPHHNHISQNTNHTSANNKSQVEPYSSEAPIYFPLSNSVPTTGSTLTPDSNSIDNTVPPNFLSESQDNYIPPSPRNSHSANTSSESLLSPDTPLPQISTSPDVANLDKKYKATLFGLWITEFVKRTVAPHPLILFFAQSFTLFRPLDTNTYEPTLIELAEKGHRFNFSFPTEHDVSFSEIQKTIITILYASISLFAFLAEIQDLNEDIIFLYPPLHNNDSPSENKSTPSSQTSSSINSTTNLYFVRIRLNHKFAMKCLKHAIKQYSSFILSFLNT